MERDPEGHYARLGLARTASPAAIATAYRRLARRLHPDVPATGNAAAFVALKAAYDVLRDPERRRAYDRRAAADAAPAARAQPASGAQPAAGAHAPGAWPEAAPEPPPGSAAWPADEPDPAPAAGFDRRFLLWIGFLLASAVAATWLMFAIASGPTADLPEPGPATAMSEPPGTFEAPGTFAAQGTVAAQGAASAARLPTARPSGPVDHFLLPGLGAATVWQGDPARGGLRPVARLAPFATVHVLGFAPGRRFAAIRLAGGAIGFVAADRLSAGDRAAARQAFCADRAGPAPTDGEVLAGAGSGPGRFAIVNRGAEPAVVKLRDATGRVVRSVFVAPGGRAVLAQVPDGPWTVDLAVGELWSRACNRFAAGEQAQRFRFPIGSGSILAVPPDLPPRAMPVAIPDRAFAQP
ncbi:MAG: J domain-containing protein [Proteobacteria bacterium]|nr:J domain-containing protein [Pseudomonadota bacterium]